MMKEIYELLDGRRLFMVYVESKKNPADNPSRGHEVHIGCWKQTLEKLEKLKFTAISKLLERGELEYREANPLFEKKKKEN